MRQLTPEGEREVQNLAGRYGVSADAVTALLSAVSAGGGTMAQFYIPELGGGGQWMQGGMTMVGDMFNGRLQSTVSGLCSELSALMGAQHLFAAIPAQGGGGPFSPVNTWWPAELGHPSTTGGQNDSRYAYFPEAQRLAVDRGGTVTVYNTLDHRIGGVQQQQGGYGGSATFSSQFGTFTVESLPVVSPLPGPPVNRSEPWQAAPPGPPSGAQPAPQTATGRASPSHEDVLGALERLGQLHQKGILSDSEFQSKKTELLSRL
jgi:hypothetical protein